MYAPSRYQFRSDAEFEQAMNEWLAENEPTYRVTYWDGDGWQTKDFPFLHEAVSFFKERRHDDYLRDDCRRAVLDTRYPAAWGHLPSRYEAPGEGRLKASGPARPTDHLDGGSRADYRMAGYRRY